MARKKLVPGSPAGGAPTRAAQIGRVVGVGRTAEIFEWGDAHVLKLFRADWPSALATAEAEIGKAIHETGLPVPGIEGIVEIGGRQGIIYERVDGPSMLQHFLAKPWSLPQLSRLFAQLHSSIHCKIVPRLPSFRRQLESTIRHGSVLSARVQEAALGILARLPDGEALCHGDFHPDNIIMSARGPIIIDWPTAAKGNPAADVARTSLLLRLAAPVPGRLRGVLSALGRRWAHASYMQWYLKTSPLSEESVRAWELPVLAARLEEGLPEERKALMRHLRRILP